MRDDRCCVRQRFLATHVTGMATCVFLTCFYKTDMIGYKHKEAARSEDYDKCG